MKKFKHIQYPILLLFFGAFVLQNISPMMASRSIHWGNMSCKIVDGGKEFCMIKSTEVCTCTHANTDMQSKTICGCNHSNTSITISPFQIKAPLLSERSKIKFRATNIFVTKEENHSLDLSDDIFHPPRLKA